MILFSPFNWIVYLLDEYNKITFECQKMRQIVGHFVGRVGKVNNKMKKSL